jgi:probable HAF family extracellular repeat protein
MSSIPGLLMAGGLAAINDRGQIVGEDMTHDEYYTQAWSEAFILQNDIKTFLGNLSGVSAFPLLSRATGINNHGQVVGKADTGDPGPSGGVSHAFMWQDGVMTDLGTLGGRWSQAFAISDDGWIVGSSETADGQFHGVLWTPVPEPPSMLGVLSGLLLMFCRSRLRGRGQPAPRSPKEQCTVERMAEFND